MNNKIYIYADGGARGNPGPAAIGVLIKNESGQTLTTISRTIGKTTNNMAEYQAVVAALEFLKSYPTIKPSNNLTIHFFLDSKLVVNQLNGYFKVKNSFLRDFILKIRTLEQEVGGNVTYKLIPREENLRADRLVNKALDRSY